MVSAKLDISNTKLHRFMGAVEYKPEEPYERSTIKKRRTI